MSLLMRDSRSPEKWYGDFPVTNRYTFGLAGEKFYRSLKDDGKIMGTYCPNCDHTYVPAAIFCERCFAELCDWVDVGIIGELHTFTLLYVNLDGSIKNEPQVIGFVKMGDGGLIHLIGEIHPEEIQIGMQLRAKLKPKKDRVGAISDIEYFYPVK